MDRPFKQWLSNTKRKKSIQDNGLTITNIHVVIDSRFWDSVAMVNYVCEPIVSLLRLVDGTQPCVGKIYWKMYQLVQGVLNSTLLDAVQKSSLSRLINNCWRMLHTDLQGLFWTRSTVPSYSMRMRK